VPRPLHPIVVVYHTSLIHPPPPPHFPHGGGPGFGMVVVVPEQQNEHQRLRLWGLQEMRGVLKVREAEGSSIAGATFICHVPPIGIGESLNPVDSSFVLFPLFYVFSFFKKKLDYGEACVGYYHPLYVPRK